MPPPSEDREPGVTRVAVLGATGYVAGELMRLLAFHPHLELNAPISRSFAGRRLSEVFPHLAGVPDLETFADEELLDELLVTRERLAVFSCLPHGAAAARLDALLARAQGAGTAVHLVDLSADFRLPTPEDYERVYGKPHGAPGRYGDFTCGLPELTAETPEGPVAHPGCFTTAVTLACAPAQASGLAEPRYRVSAVTGSTGSGRTPSATTHHPERHSDLKAYLPLAHRHQPEMEMLLARLGGEAPEGRTPEVNFVPHSGPFARGIHATVHLDLVRPIRAEELAEAYADFYRRSTFVSVGSRPPRLKEVVGSNRCRLGVAASGRRAVVLSVIDNLTKGAAGGALQWMNRLCGFEERLGLDLPGVGWA